MNRLWKQLGSKGGSLFNYSSMIYMYRVENKESHEDEIKKQALLEVMMSTQLWSQPYLKRNPFVYLTTR